MSGWIALSNITVRFGALTAVDAVSLDVDKGEIHAVVGENGAGKSTIMNVLFGLLVPDEGTIAIGGTPHAWKTPQDAIAHGIGMVHQHFMLQDSMTVLENVVLCAEPVNRLGIVDFATARAKLEDIIATYGIRSRLDARVADLSVSERQVVEILKVLYREAEVLILDEPTAVLTPQETRSLFEILANFKAAGKAIVIITHKLDEVMEVADTVSVMRGGRLVSSGPREATSKDEIARGIIGGDLPAPRARGPYAPGAPVLKVTDLVARGEGRPVGPVSLEVRKGEIVGVAAVAGNGQAELIETIVGLRRSAGGTVSLDGQDLAGKDVAARRALGLSYIPTDRQRVGLALEARVSENALIGREMESRFRRGLFQIGSQIDAFAREVIARYRIKVAGPRAKTSSMSGGNKQKLVVGRELSRETPLVIAENPTWGVDIGAIDFIHGELVRMRDAGHAILLVSTEIDEILALSDRIVVMFEGRITGSFAASDADRFEIGALMTSHGSGGIQTRDAS
ncbi:ABC transporter ATP-binding protein [Pelagibacterium montanilacus]|uniref:ABC transporter ATP-binding protein n=1 Tax=Pelagibacterium montanilacus TaxID=2185280 RepID=UPI001FEC06A9|nr:ABC transporter ATP-binding protein [Pelagibacterium montanilacus]